MLMDVVKFYREYGCGVEVISMEDGPLREELERDGVIVNIMERFWPVRDVFAKAAEDYDLVWANTLITYEAVLSLIGTDIPVVWWLHEGEQYFEYFKTVLPDFSETDLMRNVHVYVAGYYVRDVVKKRYGIEFPILNFAVTEDVNNKSEEDKAEDRLKFLIVGTYSYAKGQDVLCAAVRKLAPDIMHKTEFAFCGRENMADESVLGAVKDLDAEYENVTLLHQLPREEVFRHMRNSDCLIVPSRIEPTSAVAVEMMQSGKPVLCTDVCGVAHYIKDGYNGFTVVSDNATALCEKITELVKRYFEPAGLEYFKNVGEKGYEIYRDHFSKEVVDRQLADILSKLTGGGLETGMDKKVNSVNEEKTSQKKTTVFVMTHKKFDEPEDPVYVPVQVGAAGKPELGYIADNTGDNISEKNCLYGELTGLYWLWKNLENTEQCPDYVGICHYRRYFVHEDYSLLSEKDYAEILRKYDIITSVAIDEGAPYRDYFGEAHSVRDIELEGEIIQEICPEYYDTFERVMAGNTHYYGNLCVMKREDFNAYCSWLFGIFDVMEDRIDLTGRDAYHRRIYGFLSEQLLKVWIEYNQKTVFECKIGMTAEKAETVEFKLAISQLVSDGNISEARKLFYQILKLRPDIRLPLSDIRGEIPLIEQILYIMETEQERGLVGMLAWSTKLTDEIAHVKKLINILAEHDHVAASGAGEARFGWIASDIDYFGETFTTPVAVEVLCRNSEKLQDDWKKITEDFEAVYKEICRNYTQINGQKADNNYEEYPVAVSVIVPVYNAENYLAHCVGNLLNQTLKSIEIILVNDASADGSLKICMDAEKQAPDRVAVIDLSDNVGAGGARNVGLMYARGEYIGFVDSDDIPDVTMFEKLYRAAKSNDADMADAGYYSEETDLSMVHTADECTGEIDDSARSELIVSGGYLWTRLFKRSIFESAGDKPFREHCILEDADFLTWVYATARRVCNVKEVLYRYRKCGISIHNERSPAKYDANIKAAMKAIYDRVHELPNYKKIQAAVEYELLQMYALGVTNIASDYKGGKTLDSKTTLSELAALKKSVVGLGYDNKYVAAKIDEASVRAMKAADKGWEEVARLMK